MKKTLFTCFCIAGVVLALMAASPVLYVGTHVGNGVGLTNVIGSPAAFLSDLSGAPATNLWWASGGDGVTISTNVSHSLLTFAANIVGAGDVKLTTNSGQVTITGTNTVLIPGSNVTITTNVTSGQNAFTIAATGGGGDVFQSGQNNFSGSNYFGGGTEFANNTLFTGTTNEFTGSVGLGNAYVGTMTVTGGTIFSNNLAIDAAHTLSVSNLTPSRVVLTTSGDVLSSATASGTIPMNADGSATTFPQIQLLAPGTIATNGATTPISFTGGWLSTGSNYITQPLNMLTNQHQVTPDFSIPEQLMSTNAAFTFLAPVGVDATKTEAQWTLVNVTNTTAVAIAITPPANCHGIGTLFVTNWSLCYFQCYAQKITNMFVVTVF